VLVDDDSVQTIRGILDVLVGERERLRAAGETQALEANRLAIAYWHQALANLLAGSDRR